MKFGFVFLEIVIGGIFVYLIKLSGKIFKKGYVFLVEDCRILLLVGYDKVVVVMLELGDVEEDVVVICLVYVVKGLYIVEDVLFIGCMNLYVECDGVLVVDKNVVIVVNWIDLVIIFVMLVNYSWILVGCMVVIVKIILFVVVDGDFCMVEGVI